MTQVLTPGSRWTSAVDDTEVIVVRAAAAGLVLECGGAPMLAGGSAKTGGGPDPEWSAGTAVGKRFEHESGLEVLCTKGGAGSLGVSGTPMSAKEAKPLPSSD